MAVRTTLTLTVAAAAVAAAGIGGYLLSEAQHGDVGVPRAEVLLDARTATPTAPAATLPAAPATSAAPPVSEPSRPSVTPKTATARSPRPEATPPTAPQASEPPVAEPVPVPALTSAVRVASGEAPLANTSPVDLPVFAPPVQQIELVVSQDSVIGVRLDEPLSSATARVEDRVTAVVTRDVIVDGRTAVPAGSRVEGHVTVVERGGKFREKARVGLVFSTLVLSETRRFPIATETIYRDGESPAAEATSKIGASAVVGTVLGAIIGGKKGAAIGGAAGAAGGTAVVAAGGTNDVVLAAGASLTLRLTEPVTVIIDRDPERD